MDELGLECKFKSVSGEGSVDKQPKTSSVYIKPNN